MKTAFLLVLIIAIQNVYALPCPNGQGILYKGDSIASVLKQCGEPDQKSTRTMAVNNTQEWMYYVTQPFYNTYTQVFLIFNNDFITRIHKIDQNVTGICTQTVSFYGRLITTRFSCGNLDMDVSFINMCGRTFGIGDSLQSVLAYCGPPNSQNTLQANVVEQTEFIYLTQPPQTIIFQNGVLTDWK